MWWWCWRGGLAKTKVKRWQKKKKMQIHSWLGEIDGGPWEEATTRGRGWRWNKRQKCSLDEIFWEVDLGV